MFFFFVFFFLFLFPPFFFFQPTHFFFFQKQPSMQQSSPEAQVCPNSFSASVQTQPSSLTDQNPLPKLLWILLLRPVKPLFSLSFIVLAFPVTSSVPSLLSKIFFPNNNNSCNNYSKTPLRKCIKLFSKNYPLSPSLPLLIPYPQ